MTLTITLAFLVVFIFIAGLATVVQSLLKRVRYLEARVIEDIEKELECRK